MPDLDMGLNLDGLDDGPSLDGLDLNNEVEDRDLGNDMMSLEASVDDEPIIGPDQALPALDGQSTNNQDDHTDGLSLSDLDEPTPAQTPSAPKAKGATLDAGQIFNDQAILKVEGPRTIRIRTGAHPFPVRITVRNVGEGRMPGHISVNVPWVQISPAILDPSRFEQIIEALVEPDAIPGNAAKAVLTFETDHGETASINIDALKHVVSPVMMLVSALSFVGIIGLFAGLYLSGIIGTDSTDTTTTILAINVDPPAGEVFVDDVLIGKQGTLSMLTGFPIGEPFQVRVELDGFEPFVKDVVVNWGTQIRVDADLVLRDRMMFSPPPEAAEADIDDEALDALIAKRQGQLDACFTRNFREGAPLVAEIVVNGVVSPRGFIHGISFENPNFQSPAVETCLMRQFRAMRLPLVPGDYGRFKRKLDVEIRPSNALNDENMP